jgi:hypothetical protein
MASSQPSRSNSCSYPRLRENVWWIDPTAASARLRTSKNQYEVPTEDALMFLKMRRYCTGHHTVEDVARRSEIPCDKVVAILNSLQSVDLLYPDNEALEHIDLDAVRDTLVRACDLWATEVAWILLGRELMREELTQEVLLGGLVEAYHETREFSDALASGARRLHGGLGEVVARCAAEREGLDRYYLRTLVNLGLSEHEVKTSVPLLATRLVGFLVREMLELEPVTALLAVSVVGARHLANEEIEALRTQLRAKYDVDPSALEPYFALQSRETDIGHQRLLADHCHLVDIDDLARLDSISNKVHDLIHAFILQSQEIKSYHSKQNGNYFPRQPVSFPSI